MAIDAARVFKAVPRMIGTCEPLRQVALAANIVWIRTGYQRGRMRVVTITASHACRVHATLQERAIDIDFVANLAIVKVQRLVKQGDPMGIGQRLAVLVCAGY